MKDWVKVGTLTVSAVALWGGCAGLVIAQGGQPTSEGVAPCDVFEVQGFQPGIEFIIEAAYETGQNPAELAFELDSAIQDKCPEYEHEWAAWLVS